MFCPVLHGNTVTCTNESCYMHKPKQVHAWTSGVGINTNHIHYIWNQYLA